MTDSFSRKLGNITGTALIWGFAGALFGGAFSALYQFWLLMGAEGWLALIWSTILAGTVTASFFGSLVVALAGTLTGILVAIPYQIIFSGAPLPAVLMLIAFILGWISGEFFSQRELERYQPLGQAGSGLMAGLFAGLLLALTSSFHNMDSNDWGLSAVAVTLVGSTYLFISQHIPTSIQEGSILKVGGPLVCALISLSVAFGFWLIGESMDLHWSNEPVSRYYNVLVNVPSGTLGGAIGGTVAGITLSILGVKLEKRLHAD